MDDILSAKDAPRYGGNITLVGNWAKQSRQYPEHRIQGTTVPLEALAHHLFSLLPILLGRHDANDVFCGTIIGENPSVNRSVRVCCCIVSNMLLGNCCMLCKGDKCNLVTMGLQLRSSGSVISQSGVGGIIRKVEFNQRLMTALFALAVSVNRYAISSTALQLVLKRCKRPKNGSCGRAFISSSSQRSYSKYSQ